MRDELTLTAKDTADARIASLVDRVTEHFGDKPSLFSAFAEPDFQYSLRDAGRAAASNDEEHTEQLLVDLLENRAAEGNGARVRLATSQALRAADKLSSEALSGLTAMWAVSALDIDSSHPIKKLAHSIHLAQRLVPIDLPSDPIWLRDCDALNLVRVQPQHLLSRKTYSEMIRPKIKNYLRPGIDLNANKESLAKVTSAVPEFGTLLEDHPFKKGFLIFGGESRDNLISQLPSDLLRPPELDALIDAIGFDQEDPEAIKGLEQLMSQNKDLAQLVEWWNNLPLADFSVVGEVIAFVNTRRLMPINNVQTVGHLLSSQASK